MPSLASLSLASLSLASLLSVVGCQARHVSAAPSAPSPQVLARRELVAESEYLALARRPNPVLDAALARFPRATRWIAQSGRFEPQAATVLRPRRVVSVDVAVFGGELESATTAIALAKRGFRVALVYDCPLGGLSSDTSGNLRYIDGLPGLPRTDSQRDVYTALGVRGNVATPDGVSTKIQTLLAARYQGKILPIPTVSLSQCQASGSDKITSVTTPEGVQVQAGKFLDTDPESRLAEICGLPYTTRTPNLSQGLVFDLRGMSKQDYKALQRKDRIQPEALAKEFGSKPSGAAAESKLRKQLVGPFGRAYESSSFGYAALASAYHYAMLCAEQTHPSEDLTWVNAHRVTSGFNISHLGTEANLNSISYQGIGTYIQHEHRLGDDSVTRRIVTVESDGLTHFFRYVTGDPSLIVRLPSEFYVRQSTAYFPTVRPYRRDDFDHRPRTRWWMRYPIDFRDLKPRDAYDADWTREAFGWRTWDCLPETCATKIPNLYLLNKCSMTPEFSGGLRIIQNLIGTGQAWADSLPKKR